MARDSCEKVSVTWWAIFIEAVGMSSLPGDLQYHVTQWRVLSGDYYLRRAGIAFLTLLAFALVSLLLSSLAFSCSFLSCSTAYGVSKSSRTAGPAAARAETTIPILQTAQLF